MVRPHFGFSNGNFRCELGRLCGLARRNVGRVATNYAGGKDARHCRISNCTLAAACWCFRRDVVEFADEKLWVLNLHVQLELQRCIKRRRRRRRRGRRTREGERDGAPVCNG